MIVNNTCVPGNDTASCLTSSSSAGLAVGLTLFFLLFVISAAIVVFKYHSKMRKMLQFGQRRSHKNKKEDCAETPRDDCHQYTGMVREQSTGQTPIYENLTTGTRCSKSKFPGEPEEDVYLQCDSPDDAIYSNDPACNLSILPDCPEEDLYIVPNS